MIEIQPQFVYSDGILDVRTDITKDCDFSDQQLDAIGRLAERPGTVYDEDGTLHVDVRQSLGENFGYARDGAVSHFLRDIGKVVSSRPESDVDHVLHARRLSVGGLVLSVYPQFQRWLNTQSELSGRVARETLLAMAAPLGEEQEKHAKANLQSYDRHASAGFYKLSLSSEEVEIEKDGIAADELTAKTGHLKWNTISLSTLGTQASIGVAAKDYRYIYSNPGMPKDRLYELKSSNIDFPQQTLSLLLGVGALAYHAAKYSGREDVFSAIQR